MARRAGRRSAQHRVGYWTTLRDGSLGSADWRPYPSASVYKPIPGTDDGSAGTPTVHADSAGIVAKVTVGTPTQMEPGNDSSALATSLSHPIYYATASDPVFEVRQITAGNSSPFWTTTSGPSFYCPQNALPADGSDAHLAVVQPDGTEWFIYKAASSSAGATLTALPNGGGIIYGTGLSKHDIRGDGLRLGGGGTATAAGVAAIYGVIRPEEVIAGQINHALFMVCNWSDNSFVAPAQALARRKTFTTSGSHTFPISAGTITVTATTNATSTGHLRLPNGSLVTYTGITGTTFTGCNGGTGGVLNTGSTLVEHYWPPAGARFQLNMTDAEIDAIPNSGNSTGRPWNKALLKAMRRYGMFVCDTGGGNWGLHRQSGFSQLALTGVDPWRTWAAGAGVTYNAGTDTYLWDYRTVVDWAAKLRVLDWNDPANY